MKLQHDQTKHNLFSSFWQKSIPLPAYIASCLAHLFPQQHQKVQCKCNDNKNNKQAVLTSHTKILLHFQGMDSKREIHSTQKAPKHQGNAFH